MPKPIILITNDDGITAPGIKVLVDLMSQIGKVIVVAPDSPQSGMGHAVTIEKPLRLEKVDYFKNADSYTCSGTPADCVKLAVNVVLHKKPDLCVSGINHGYNSSINLIYSGTMSAAMEGAFEGIPSIGFSLGDYSFEADFSPSEKYITQIVKETLAKGLPKDVFLNVNIPKISAKEIRGIKVCRQANAKWDDDFEIRQAPRGFTYYWLTGKFVNYDIGEDTDELALKNGFISLVPIHFDFTAHHAIDFFNNEWNLKD